MGNPEGHNGHDNGSPPEDLPRILQEFATDKTPLKERLATLKILNRKHNIISARRPPPLHISHSLISKQMAENPTGTNGPNTIQKRVEIIEGVALPRLCFSTRWFPTALSPPSAHASHALFLQMSLSSTRFTWMDMRSSISRLCGWATASIDVYGGKCHGNMPIQLTVDGGTETKYMAELHEYLRAIYTPNTDTPTIVALKSTDNLPIESAWNQLLQFTGHDLKAVILEGRSSSIINIGLEHHIFVVTEEFRLLFQWLWPKVVKQAINTFVRYWNNHKTRTQKEKWLPSGVALRQVYENPVNYGFKHAGKPVPREVVQQLRAMLPKSREDCMRWVPEEFDVKAWAIYKSLGSPTFSITNGWDIFTQMLLNLQ
ncbi:hypothetical protein B0H14DRAFT_2620804 [Mycena olivaceomarginata]|nr:hypothetical protein B0H14DRAFT_2620804 [Mycena olivaceomarginata]